MCLSCEYNSFATCSKCLYTHLCSTWDIIYEKMCWRCFNKMRKKRKCRRCNEIFDSGNKLFKHLKFNKECISDNSLRYNNRGEIYETLGYIP